MSEPRPSIALTKLNIQQLPPVKYPQQRIGISDETMPEECPMLIPML